jgi:hypothetical protein
MSGDPDLPAPPRARVAAYCTALTEDDLAGHLERLYELVSPPVTLPRTAMHGELRGRYLCTRADLERVCWYVADHIAGVRATLRAAASDPHASTLLSPEALLVLEGLQRDPFGLRDSWPNDTTLKGLLALADANARPLD